tara:strand:+ start:1144 stop:1581 length:438 start_codon:yes stop_codon:yes gene_type:complete
MIGKKSSLKIDEKIIDEKFELIDEGSKLLDLRNNLILVFKKKLSSINNDNLHKLNFNVVFNSVMQGEFPTIEIKINILINEFKIEELSHLISMNNEKEISDVKKYMNNDILSIIVYSFTEKKQYSFNLENLFMNDFIEQIKYFNN